MESKRAPEFNVEIYTDPVFAKDVIKGILHTIFFHRMFPAVRPLNRDILDVTLPAVDDPDLETLIDQRATTLVRQIEASVQSGSGPSSGTSGHPNSSGRGQLAVQFFERRRKKTYFFGKADEEICWEQWNIDVSVERAKTEEATKRLQVTMKDSLQRAALQVVNNANAEKDHIPPITTQDMNPFPYQIVLREQGWRKNVGYL